MRAGDSPSEATGGRILNLIGFALLAGCFVFSFSRVLFLKARGYDPDRTLLRFVHRHLELGVREAFDKVAQRYMDLHPEVLIEQMAIPEAVYNVWLDTKLFGGNVPDIVQYAEGGTPEGHFVNFFLPLSDLVAQPNPYNRGTILEQVAWKDTFFDGKHWNRGVRSPFIPLNEPGQPGGGMIYPTSLVETETELRIYSAASVELHMRSGSGQFHRRGEMPPSHILLHTLRKDGFMYLKSKGNWATFCTEPLVLLGPELSVNAHGPHGNILFQLADQRGRPLDGFRFEDCEPLVEIDELTGPLRWKGKSLVPLTGLIVRLEVKFRHTRIYAIRGDFRFADIPSFTPV